MRIREIAKDLLPEPVLDLLWACMYRHLRLKNFRSYQEHLRYKFGIEIGGPSYFFKRALPVYSVVSALDGVNFSRETLWEGTLQVGTHFRYARDKVGRQFIAEATELTDIETGRYQFLISSNCLEHVANPLKALQEWLRVIEPKGYILLVLPNKKANFDHKRPVTHFEHLMSDFQNDVSEEDLTHLPEILELHDLSMDPAAGSRENFILRSEANYKNRALHHHVFDMPLIERMCAHFGVEVLLKSTTDINFVVLGQTPGKA